jgi:hypothetical protein
MPGDDPVDIRKSEIGVAERVQRDQFRLSHSAMEGKVGGISGHQGIRVSGHQKGSLQNDQLAMVNYQFKILLILHC